MPRISVVIPNWNGMEHLPLCLAALESQTLTGFETVVVDNGSTDGSLQFIREEHPQVRVVELEGNLGFPAAVNAGIRASDSEYVVLLNNDTRAENGWLERLVSAMDETPAAGFGASKILRYDPPHPIDSVGDGYSLWKGGGYNVGAFESRANYSDRAWVFGACAAAAIYRRAMFDEIGGFDEDFFLNFEDVDLSMRAQLAGYRCLYVPDAVVYHKRGASRQDVPVHLLVGTMRNRIWVTFKSLPLPILLLVMSLNLVRFAKKVAKRNARRILYALHLREPHPPSGVDPWMVNLGFRRSVVAWSRALRALPEKRRQVQKTRKVSSRRLYRVLVTPREPIGT